jgi:hypothetical protein
MINKMNNEIIRLFQFAGLSEDEIIQRTSAMKITFLTCFFGAIYSCIYIFGYDIPHLSYIVVLYICWSVLNVGIFYYFNSYNFFRISQLTLISFFPILSQLFIGGFLEASGVGISAVLAPIGALLFYGNRMAMCFLILYITLLVGAGFIELYYLEQQNNLPKEALLLFFVLIFVFTSIIIYLSIDYVIAEKNRLSDRANTKLDVLEQEIKQLKIENRELIQFKDFSLLNDRINQYL